MYKTAERTETRPLQLKFNTLFSSVKKGGIVHGQRSSSLEGMDEESRVAGGSALSKCPESREGDQRNV